MYGNGYKLWMAMVINYGYKLWMAMVINYGWQWL